MGNKQNLLNKSPTATTTEHSSSHKGNKVKSKKPFLLFSSQFFCHPKKSVNGIEFHMFVIGSATFGLFPSHVCLCNPCGKLKYSQP